MSLHMFMWGGLCERCAYGLICGGSQKKPNRNTTDTCRNPHKRLPRPAAEALRKRAAKPAAEMPEETPSRYPVVRPRPIGHPGQAAIRPPSLWAIRPTQLANPVPAQSGVCPTAHVATQPRGHQTIRPRGHPAKVPEERLLGDGFAILLPLY